LKVNNKGCSHVTLEYLGGKDNEKWYKEVNEAFQEERKWYRKHGKKFFGNIKDFMVYGETLS
jgi:hypothetical protein